MTRCDLLVKSSKFAVRAESTAMLRRLHRSPSIPHAEWLRPENRFRHLERLLGQREPQGRFRPETISIHVSPSSRTIPGNNKRPEWAVYSRKGGAYRFAEADGERDYLIICEADPAVISYDAQPHSLNFGGVDLPFRRYTPDVSVARMDGVTEIVEIKYDYFDATSDTDYIKKLLASKCYYDKVGWKFSILTQTEDILGSVSLLNANAVETCKNDSLDDLDLYRLSVLLGRSNGKSTVAAALECLRRGENEHPALSRRKFLAAVARREIGIDIHGSIIGPSTTIWTLANATVSK